MIIRGRRVVLLIAGILPLLAENDLSTARMDDATDNPDLVVVPKPADHVQRRQVDLFGVGAAEALQDQVLSLLPLNVLQMEAQSVDDVGLGAGTTWPRRAEDQALPIPEEELDPGTGMGIESPEDRESTGVEAVVNTSDAESDANGIQDPLEESKRAGIQTSEEEGSETSANPVADVPVNKEEAIMVVSETEEKEAEPADAINSTGEPKVSIGVVDEFGSTDDIETNGGDATRKEKKMDDDQRDISAGAAGGDVAAASQGEDTLASTEQQQPPSDPMLDKMDDEEEGSIGNRVAVDYASKSAGALVLEKSPNFKGTSNLLNGDRDRYAISPCEEKKFVVLSLSEDILVKQVKLVNYELYSSRVKDFQIQISQTMGNWVELGSYTASPASGEQTFDLTAPAWGRYLMFKFTSHYGNEYYCTLTQIMVHGSTMIQGFHEHLQETNEEDEEQDNQRGEEPSHEEREALGEDADDGLAPVSKRNLEAEPLKHGAIQEDAASASRVSEEDVYEAGKSVGADDVALNESTKKDRKVASEDGSVGIDGSEESESETLHRSNVEVNESEASKMRSKKLRSSGTALPAASIGLSSKVFTTIMGRLDPLHLKSIHRLSSVRSPSFTNPDKLQNVFSQAADSTKAIKMALGGHAILENLHFWNEVNTKLPFPPEAFGTIAIGPREQTLTEKLTAYVGDSGDDEMRKVSEEAKQNTESQDVSVVAAGKRGKKNHSNNNPTQRNPVIDMTGDSEESPEEEQASAKAAGSGKESYEKLHETDLSLANLLDKLPSIACLKKLDFAAFKEKALASRKGGHGAGGPAAAGSPAEPIFKMLTDQIKLLQSNLSVHDQFTKETVQCYQKVLLDVVVELETMRIDHEARLSKLERDLEETKTVRWIFVLYQIVMGLPHWASLLAATAFTSFVSPSAVTKPLELFQTFLDKYMSQGDHVILSWTITACVVVLCCVSTASLCYKLLSAIRCMKNRPEVNDSLLPEIDGSEANSCRFTVETANGEVVPILTQPESNRVNAYNLDNNATEVANEGRSGLPLSFKDHDSDHHLAHAMDTVEGSSAGTIDDKKTGKTDESDEAAEFSDPSVGQDNESRSSNTTDIPEAEHFPNVSSVEAEGGSGILPSSEITTSATEALNQPGTISLLIEISSLTVTAGGAPVIGPTKVVAAVDTVAARTSPVAIQSRFREELPDEALAESTPPPHGGEPRWESGTRTPDAEVNIALRSFPGSLTKGQVSPSSVARVSDFAAGSERTDSACLSTRQRLFSRQAAGTETNSKVTPLQKHYTQKRRTSI